MRPLVSIVVIMCLVAFGVGSACGQERVYEEGTVWSVGMIATNANMQEEYIKDLQSAWKKARR